MISYNSKYFVSFTALAFATTANALAVTPSNDATALAQALLGPGITLVSATYTGAADGSGLYTAGPQGIRDSIVLTSGNAIDVVPGSGTSGEISKSKDSAGSTLCQSLNGDVGTFDAAVLSMNVILEPTFTGFFSEFVFTTEEYPEWVGSDFNDVFGIYIDNTQIAFDTNNAPITINGPFFSSSSVLTPPDSGSSMDGSTPLLTSGHIAAPGAHTIDIAICDTADSLLDSAVFVALGACTGECKSGTVVSPCAGKGGDSDNDGICDDVDNCPDVYNPDQDASVCAVTSSSSIISVPTNSTSSPINIIPSPTNPTSSSVVSITSSASSSIITSSSIANTTSSPYFTAPYGNNTITAAPAMTETGTPPCVTFTSYIIKTITVCPQKDTCHPTTTVSPTVVTSTLHLTVYTPCSTVTVSKCAGGPGSPCVTYTNTVTYPAITGYPPVPTFTAPVYTVPYGNSDHGCPGGVNCPHPISSTAVSPSSAIPVCPGGANCPHPALSSSVSTPVVISPSTNHTVSSIYPGSPSYSLTTSKVTLSHTSAAPVCPGSPNCPPAASSVAAKPSTPVCPGGAGCPATSKNVTTHAPTTTPVAAFTGAASHLSGMTFTAALGFVVVLAVIL